MASIGETLRNARLQKKASEETVAKVLKIKIEKLKDLEENRFDRFAAPVYVRSFIRNYANYLQIDAKTLTEQYEKENPAPERIPIFDVKEESRAHTFIRHQPPAKVQGMALTTTGRAVFIASLALVTIVIVAAVFLYKSPAPQNRSTSHGSENESDTSGTQAPAPVQNAVSTTPSLTSSNSTSEPWKVPVPTRLDTALTYSTNSTSTSSPAPATPPTSLPGQAVHIP